ILGTGGGQRRPPARHGQLVLVAQGGNEQAGGGKGPERDQHQQRQMGGETPQIDARPLADGDGPTRFSEGGHQRVPSSAPARRMFQTMIGITASMITTAMAEPRP